MISHDTQWAIAYHGSSCFCLGGCHARRFLVLICPAVITGSKQTPPPWKALSEDPTKLIAHECLPGGSTRFGSSPEKTLRDHRNAFIKHWFRVVGYLEFHHHYGRGGTFVEPDAERWHALPKYEQAFNEQWLSNERTPRGKAPSTPRASGAIATVKFGSRGPQVSLDDQSPYHCWEVLQPDEPLECLLDPDDRLRHERPPHRPGLPSWPAPCLVPDTVYARLQWSSQFLDETEGQAAATLLQSVKWLAQLPVRLPDDTHWRTLTQARRQPVANYEYDMKFFRRQEGKERMWTVESLPDWVTWGLARSYLDDQNEIDSLAAFLETRAWSFKHEGKTRFAGVEMAWTIALAAMLYVRALRHAEEVLVSQPSRWSVSGGSEWQQRARSYSFRLNHDDFRNIVHEFRCYLEELALSLPVSGLPPSLLYCRHSSREQYVYTLTRPVAELRELFSLVITMVSAVLTNKGSVH